MPVREIPHTEEPVTIRLTAGLTDEMNYSAASVGLAGVVALASACGSTRPEASWDDARLAAALTAPDPETRSRAAYLLGERSADDAYWPLVRALGDSRWEVRADAARALGRVKRRDALIPLSHALRDRHWWVRVKAIQALGERHDPTAAPFLSASLADENESARAAAERALTEARP